MEAQQCAELTGTNRSCGLTIPLRQPLKLAPGVRVTNLRSSKLAKDALAISPTPRGLARNQRRPETSSKNDAPLIHPNFPVVISRRPHPIPSRTRKLSSLEPMVLLGRPSGRVGRRRVYFEKPASICLRAFLLFILPIVGFAAVSVLLIYFPCCGRCYRTQWVSWLRDASRCFWLAGGVAALSAGVAFGPIVRHEAASSCGEVRGRRSHRRG